MSQFYRVLPDPKANQRWYLKSPVDSNGQEVDPRSFTSCNRYESVLPLRLPIRRDGKPVAFNFCDFDMIVTQKYLNNALQDLVGNSIQRIPVEVDASEEKYEILNVLDAVECISEGRSEFTKWTEDSGRPDKIGQFRMITKLFIDPEKARAHTIFRVKEWKIALIIDESVKRLLEKNSASSIIFQPVN